MDGSITVRGVVTTRPRHLRTADGLAVASFRILSVRSAGSSHRSWFTVTALRRLADAVERSLAPGDAVLVTGRLRVREWTGTARGSTAEVEAEAIGLEVGAGRFSSASAAPDASPANDR
ncbi:hypothetical protein LLS1_09190 [Leifsonia sp. LS1]|uniref:single-stranded DNA-binding protein n=1 Tax=Leifsonia sp. LS1 TaxID=2828483 RepID=UPI001CFCF7A9|nr:single-stranded DNA-binding protein [Leifsonia sp. LS1]GIT79250.1 hypothetical protein LLS1_09190 [Leifsonia sp. LS1]